MLCYPSYIAPRAFGFAVPLLLFVQLLWSYRRPGNKTTTEMFILNSVLGATNGSVVWAISILTVATMCYYSYSFCQLCSNADLDLSTMFAAELSCSKSVLFSIRYFCGADSELQDHSSINHNSVLMYIQINIVTALYRIPFVTEFVCLTFTSTLFVCVIL